MNIESTKTHIHYYLKSIYISLLLGSDIIKNDGIYSKYLFSFSGNGRYSLKVHVQANRTTVPQTAMPWSHAMYIPGYVENGKMK